MAAVWLTPIKRFEAYNRHEMSLSKELVLCYVNPEELEAFVLFRRWIILHMYQHVNSWIYCWPTIRLIATPEACRKAMSVDTHMIVAFWCNDGFGQVKHFVIYRNSRHSYICKCSQVDKAVILALSHKITHQRSLDVLCYTVLVTSTFSLPGIPIVTEPHDENNIWLAWNKPLRSRLAQS